jgi:cullin 1
MPSSLRPLYTPSNLQEDSSPDYLIKAEECLRDEEERVNSYLHVSTRPKLLKEAENELLRVHQMQLLEKEHSGCAALLRDDKKSDLARMYRMFNRLPKGLEPMADIFCKHVEEEGMRLVRETTEAAETKKEKDREAGKASKEAGSSSGPESQFIRGVITLHDKYIEYVQDSFGNSSLFHKALKDAFEAFCNKQVAGASMAELMATFCDNLLKKGGSEKLGDEDLELVLDKLVRLLAYISDKDLFSEFYRKKLARRLLHATSASEDHEKGLLTRLKQQCGAQFTSKMEGMVNDLQMAKERERQFEEWRERKGLTSSIELNVTVLTTGFWPTYKQLEVGLPDVMMQGVEQYTQYFDEVNSKTRRLAWQFTNGTVHVKASYDKSYELILMPLQAAVLLPFNDSDVLSYAELREQTKLPDEDLTRCLASLTLSKYKLLVKEGGGKGISHSDKFSVNPKFADKMRRIRVPLPPVDDRKKVQEDVDKDRKHAIEAAIVRIMKSRKALKHQQVWWQLLGFCRAFACCAAAGAGRAAAIAGT